MSSTNNENRRRAGTRVEHTYRHIKTLILSAELPPGAPINEVQIARELEISRTPLREAIRQLEHDGLVVRYPNKGVFVRQMAMKEFFEIWQIREWLEPLACEIAARNIAESALKELEKELLRLREANPGIEEYEINHRIDIQLHSLILETTGNQTLKKVIAGLNNHIMHVRMVHTPEHFRASVDDHLEIISALLARDSMKASDAMRKHLENAREYRFHS